MIIFKTKYKQQEFHSTKSIKPRNEKHSLQIPTGKPLAAEKRGHRNPNEQRSTTPKSTSTTLPDLRRHLESLRQLPPSNRVLFVSPDTKPRRSPLDRGLGRRRGGSRGGRGAVEAEEEEEAEEGGVEEH